VVRDYRSIVFVVPVSTVAFLDHLLCHALPILDPLIEWYRFFEKTEACSPHETVTNAKSVSTRSSVSAAVAPCYALNLAASS
jgi:hypothetical protein